MPKLMIDSANGKVVSGFEKRATGHYSNEEMY